MKIKELFSIAGWKIFCRMIFSVADIESVDPVEYGDTVARRIYAKYAEKPVNDQYVNYKEIEGDDANALMAADIALTYGDSWKRIKTALDAEYNPIENYDRYQADEKHHSSDGENVLGEREDTKGRQVDTDGQHIITYGEQENVTGEQTNTQGQQQITQGQQSITVGAHNDTHEHQKSAYDTAGYTAESKDIDDIAQRQDINGQRIDTAGEREDTIGERTDTLGEHQDTYGSHDLTYGERKDKKGEETDTTHLEGEELFDSHVHGNIGVTTNQQMIGQEIDMRLRWKFVDIVTRDIINEMTLKCY